MRRKIAGEPFLGVVLTEREGRLAKRGKWWAVDERERSVG